jgi:hypothetical protein
MSIQDRVIARVQSEQPECLKQEQIVRDPFCILFLFSWHCRQLNLCRICSLTHVLSLLLCAHDHNTSPMLSVIHREPRQSWENLEKCSLLPRLSLKRCSATAGHWTNMTPTTLPYAHCFVVLAYEYCQLSCVHFVFVFILEYHDAHIWFLPHASCWCELQLLPNWLVSVCLT